MAEFAEFREQHREPSFIRPIDGRPVDPAGRDAMSRLSRQSTRSWVYASQHNPPEAPPPEPIPYPTPAMNARGLAELDPDEEYMTVDPNGPDLESGIHPARVGSPNSRSGRRGFVGGFVRGLTKLPRVVIGYGSEKRKQARRGTETMITEGGTTGETSATGISTLPRYDSTPEVAPSNGQYVENMDMPIEEPALAPNRHHRTPSSATERPVGPRDPQEGDTASFHHDTIPSGPGVDSPVLVEPQPASDYAKMDSPVHTESETSFTSQVSRLHKFFRDINDLPWVSSRVTADYIPGESHRRSYSHDRPKPVASWYTHPHHQSVDLLSGATSPTSPGTRSRHRAYPTGAHMRGSAPTLAYPNVPLDRHRRVPRASDEIPLAPSSDGHNHGYPMYPHGYAPQPLFVMQQPGMQMHTGSASALGHPEMRQAVPVYMVAAPPQIFNPSIPSHINERTGSHYAFPIPPPPPPVQPI